VKQLVSNRLPNWIICDYNPHLIVDIAEEFHVKLISYSVVSAATLVFLGSPSNTMKAHFSPESLTSPANEIAKSLHLDKQWCWRKERNSVKKQEKLLQLLET